ncbi:hypothetical protein AMELA_G00267910 [Ameiurus melas]|uniref:Uncharacterized protein n=1 Tax=Ameiurus melas TaxID=219545 RepID=A0A7J5ZN49_AMEME|nr:hypothetical protein AMELA_G00267910 [Ameiurus melas]
MLLRVLPSVYPLEPDPIHQHIQDLILMIPDLDQTSRQHLLRLLQMISDRHPQVLTCLVPSLIDHLSDASSSDALFAVLVNIAKVSPASLNPFLPALRTVGQQTPGLLGHVAKIHGAVGLTSEALAREALQYLVSLLACMEHSVHHTVLLEIHSVTERYSAIIGGGAKDVYRMSNSFSAIARLLGRRLQADTLPPCRESKEVADLKRCESDSRKQDDVKIQAFEEKLEEEVAAGAQGEAERVSPAPQRCQSLEQVAWDEHRDNRFNRSKSLALHAVQTCSTNPDCIQDREGELSTEDYLIEATLCPEISPAASSAQEEHREHHDSAFHGERDRLWKHLRDNLEKIRAFCADMVTRIPMPERCVIEGTRLQDHWTTKCCFTNQAAVLGQAGQI